MTLNSRPYLTVHAGLACCLLWFGCEGAQDGASEAEAPSGGSARGGSNASAGKGGGGGAAGAASTQTRDVKIRFRAVVADRDFACGETYEQIGSTRISATPAEFRFYVQDVKLVAADGEEVPVKMDNRAPWQTPDVALIDFEDMTGSCHGTAETNDSITGTVPAGAYKGIIFSNGVPEALNHLEQSTQPAPLDLTELYWAWLTGYRFFNLEMQEAGDAAAIADTDAGLTLPGLGLLHVGSAACSKDGCKKKSRNEIRLADFDPDADVIAADAAAVFVQVDLTQDTQCHSNADVCAPMYQRIGLSWATGESIPEQHVYRVVAGGK